MNEMMSRVNSFLLIFVLVSTGLVAGCKKDKNTGLIGTYSRTQQFGAASYKVELRFTDNGLLIWMPVDSIPGHTASAVKFDQPAEERFRIYDDPDCGNEGIYSFYSNADGVEIGVVSDLCDPRKGAMSGYWERK